MDLNRQISEARDRRGELLGQLEGINNRAHAEKRDLNDDEQREWDRLSADLRSTDGELRRIEQMLEARGVTMRAGRVIPVQEDSFEAAMGQYSYLRALRAQVDQRGRDAAGREIEVAQELERRHGIEAQGVLVPAELFFGRSERRAQEVATGSLGGHLVPTDHRDDMFIDSLRPNTPLMLLGAERLTDLRGDVEIPKRAGSASTEWLSEGQEASESDGEYAKITLRPKRVTSITRMSGHTLVQSSPDIERLTREDHSRILNEELTRVAVNGSGVGSEPLGIVNTTGVAMPSAFSSAVPTWDELMDVVGSVADADALMGQLGWLLHPSLAASLRAERKDSGSGRFVMERGQIGDDTTATSSLVPHTAGSLTRVFFGDWSSLIIGTWGVVDVVVNPFSESAFKADQVLVRTQLYADVAIRHPESFAIGNYG